MRNIGLSNVVLALALIVSACAEAKQSAVEGKLVDWNGNPVAGVKITASQIQPLKGYEQLEAVTKSDGSFRITGLFPSSKYVLAPTSDKWTCQTEVRLDSAPEGETAILRSPMVIDHAFSKTSGGSLVTNLATGATRITVSSEGVVADAQSGLEWVVMPRRKTDYRPGETDYAEAKKWVAACSVAGGGWRIPTGRELATLYQEGVGRMNMDPMLEALLDERVAGSSGYWVWMEPRDASTVSRFSLFDGRHGDDWPIHGAFGPLDARVLGVRSSIQRKKVQEVSPPVAEQLKALGDKK